MTSVKKPILGVAVFFLFTLSFVYVVTADHNGYRDKAGNHDSGKRERSHHRERERNHDGNGGKGGLEPVSNRLYRESCGACHFVYQPELLPSRSWIGILGRLDEHFGESLEIEPSAASTIKEYLDANGAEHSRAKRAVKIVKSLGGQIPGRITEIPYIQRKHRGISSAVLNRPSIGSLSNCAACHVKAEEGIYDDDDVVIPD